MVGTMVERAVHCTYYEKTTIFDHFELKKIYVYIISWALNFFSVTFWIRGICLQVM